MHQNHTPTPAPPPPLPLDEQYAAALARADAAPDFRAYLAAVSAAAEAREAWIQSWPRW